MIDIHILTMPYENKQFLRDCLKSLEGEPVVTHIVDGIPGNICAARKRAFLLGGNPYVSSVDPDDFILPGCFSTALDILENNPNVAGTYCFEYVVGDKLVLSDRSINRLPHHAMVFRRSVFEQFLPVLDSIEVVKTLRGAPWYGGEWQAIFNAIGKQHCIIEIAKPYYVWRRHKDSFTVKGPRRVV